MITIIDYGVGNLFSLKSSLEAMGRKIIVTNDEKIIESAGKIILPGVGAFSDAMEKLKALGLDAVIKKQVEKQTPLLGICLGMQLLFEKSMEYGEHEGLGLIPGTVAPISDLIPPGLKVPHTGWNKLLFAEDKPKNVIFKYIEENECVYFVHSYAAINCAASVIATSEYGTALTAAVANKNVYGCQFHPEKSGWVGLSILQAFCEIGE